jgi:hypothetical protein
MGLDLQTVIGITGHLLWLLTWLGFSWFTGTVVLSLLGRWDGRQAIQMPNLELKFFFSTCSGIALQFPVLIGLALAGAFRPWFIGAAALLMLTGAIVLWRQLRPYGPVHPAGNSGNATFWFELLPLVLLIVAWVIRPHGPPMSHDDISYHLPYARFYLEQGGLAVNEFLRYPLHAHNYNLLYSVALLREGTTMAAWVHGASGYLVMLGTWGLARHWFGWLGAVAATASLLLLKIFRLGMGNAYVDLGLTLFLIASVAALVLWMEHRRQAWLWLSAALLGTALGIKYSTVALAGLLGLMVIHVTRNIRQVLVFAGIAAAFGCFWYLRSFIISGNPVHPFASNIFGYYIWTAVDMQSQLGELGVHGVEKTPLNFLLLPYLLLTQAKEFHGAAGLVGLLIGLFFLSLVRFRQWPPALRALSILSLAYLVFWFSTAQVVRYLLPVTPLLALAVASLAGEIPKILHNLLYGGDEAEDMVGQVAFSRLGQLIVIIPIAVFAHGTISHDLRWLPLSEQAKDLRLSEQRAGYELYRVARAHPDIGRGPVLQLRIEADRFFYDGTLYGDWHGPYRYRQFVEKKDHGFIRLKSPRYFWERLRADGIRALVLSKNGGVRYYPKDVTEFEPWFDIVFSNRFGNLLVPKSEVPQTTDEG